MSLLNNYLLKGTIGRGSYSKVKLGLDTITGKKYAIKIHKDDDKKSKKVIEVEDLIAKELEALKGANHPNVIQLIEYIPSASIQRKDKDKVKKVKCVVVEEHASGGELFYYVKNSGAFIESQARYIFRQMIEGLNYMHNKGFAHRDIKPDNILLDSEFNVKIADFGFSGPIQGRYNDTYMRTTCGTKQYEAPEILEQRKYKGADVDLFAAGVVLFIMVAGTPPFQTADIKNDYYYQKIASQQHKQFWDAHLQARGTGEDPFSVSFKDLIQRMLAYEPSERLTAEQIMSHPWYQGPIPLYAELKQEFQQRKEKNTLETKKAKKGSSKNADRYRGAGGSGEEVGDDDEEIELERPIKSYDPEIDEDIQTKIFYNDSPDKILELLEQFVNWKENEGYTVQLEIQEGVYKGSIRQFDQEDNITVESNFKILKAEKNEFCLEFIVYEENEAGAFMDLFQQVQNFLDKKLGYTEEGEDEDP